MKEQNKKRLDTMLFFTALALVAAIFIALCVGFVNFDNIPAGTRVEKDSIIASVTHESDIKLTQAVSSADSNSVEVTATVSPTSSITGIDWTLEFANPDSEWASGKSVADYVALSVDSTQKIATLTCQQAFGEQIVLTVSADMDSTVYATCNVEYSKKFVGFSNVDIEATGGILFVDEVETYVPNKITASNVYSFGTWASRFGNRGPGVSQISSFAWDNIANYTTYTKDSSFTFNTYFKTSSALASYYPGFENYTACGLDQYSLILTLTGAKLCEYSTEGDSFLYVGSSDDAGYKIYIPNATLMNDFASNLRACNGSFITIKIEVLCDGVVVDTIERELTLDVNSLPAGVSDVTLSTDEVVF